MATIISKEEFRVFYPDSSLSDEQLEAFLCLITESVNNMSCADTVEYATDHEEYHVGNGSSKLYVCKRPIVNFTELKINGCVVDPAKYLVKENYIQIKRGVFPSGMDIYERTAVNYTESAEVEVKYDGGWIFTVDGPPEVQGTVPCDLKMAIAGLLNGFESELSDEGKLKSYSISDISYTFKSYTERNQTFNSIINNYFPVM